MSPPRRVEHAEELLDEPHHDAHELAQSLGHVASVNQWLGGVAALLAHLKPYLRACRSLRILDVATGSGDIPLRIAEWARRHSPNELSIVATDVHPQMVALAAQRCAAYPEITVEQADALNLPYGNNSFDIATLSLALHHFEGAGQTRVLREMGRVSTTAIIVNDLERTWLNYAGSKLLAHTLWRGNRLTRHDGPLSVLRSFTKDELRDIANNAGIICDVRRHFFQRIVMEAAVSTEFR